MIKKTTILVLIIAIVVIIAALVSCNANEAGQILIVDGDVENGLIQVDLSGIKQERYSYEEDGTTVRTKGWNLSKVIEDVVFLEQDSFLMITGAEDGVSAVVEGRITGTIYLYYDEEGTLSAKSIDYPPVCSIKNISEITIIAKEITNSGYKILSENSTEYISWGNAKLKLYDKNAENILGENTAIKYTLKIDNTVSAFTKYEENVVYYLDYDIEINADLSRMLWMHGGLAINGKQVFGFASGTSRMIYDAYDEMKTYLEQGKVMYILPDGFSYEQAKYFSDDLDLLKPIYAELALSTHLAISPVALASIVTGETPFINGVFFNEGQSRSVLEPKVSDIFSYANSLGKSISYLEGNSNLIITSISPTLSLSDFEIYEKAKNAIVEGDDLIFIHFHEIDDVNHEFGPLSNQALTKISYIESYIEYLVSQFDGKVIIVPDHGHMTMYDEDNIPYGDHGLFTNLDMFVPYYVIEKNHKDDN